MLAALGYKQEFKRTMGPLAVIGMAFTAIGILTGMSSAFQQGLFFGGPLGLFWGWNVCAIGMQLIALSLSEICSVYPTAGGIFYWVKRMSDKPWLSFFTGNVYAWSMVLTGTSGCLSVALYIASMVNIGAGVKLTPLQIAAIAWGVCITSGIVNSFGTRAIAAVSRFNVWWTLGGTIVLVATLLAKSADGAGHNSAGFVFTDFENISGYDSKGFVVLLGFLQAVYTLEGCETGAQVAEEAKNAAWAAPVSISVSIVGSW